MHDQVDRAIAHQVDHRRLVAEVRFDELQLGYVLKCVDCAAPAAREIIDDYDAMTVL